MTFGIERLKRAGRSSEAERAHLERVASGFIEDPALEARAALIEADPEGFRALPWIARMAAADYAQRREAARRLAELEAELEGGAT